MTGQCRKNVIPYQTLSPSDTPQLIQLYFLLRVHLQKTVEYILCSHNSLSSPLSKQYICLCTICPFFVVLNIAFSPPFYSISLLHPLILADNSSQAFAFSYFSFISATISTTSPLPFVIEFSLYKSDSIWFR